MALSSAGTQNTANPRSSDDRTFQPEASTSFSSSFSEKTSRTLGAMASCRLNLSTPDCSSVTV